MIVIYIDCLPDWSDQIHGRFWQRDLYVVPTSEGIETAISRGEFLEFDEVQNSFLSPPITSRLPAILSGESNVSNIGCIPDKKSKVAYKILQRIQLYMSAPSVLYLDEIQQQMSITVKASTVATSQGQISYLIGIKMA